jgi:hypothetical protein
VCARRRRIVRSLKRRAADRRGGGHVAGKDIARALSTDRRARACFGKRMAAYSVWRARADRSGRGVAFQRDTLRCSLV